MSPLNQVDAAPPAKAALACHDTGAFKVDTTHEARTGLRNEAASND